MKSRKAGWALAGVALWFALGWTTWAQEEPKDAGQAPAAEESVSQPPPAEQPPTPPNASPPTNDSSAPSQPLDPDAAGGENRTENSGLSPNSDKPVSAADLGKRNEHIVYVPYSKLGDVFENEKGNVLLSFEEYQRLWKTVRELGATTEKPPLPAILTRIEYVGTVQDQSGDLTARLLVDSLVDDWVKLPVSFPAAAISSVSGATLAAQKPGDYLLILKGKKLHEVVLKMSVPLTDTPEGKALTLHGPVAASTQLTLTLPGQNLSVDVTPKLATTKVEPTGDRTTVTAILGAVETVALSWKDRKQEAPAETLAVAQSENLVTVGDGIIRTQSHLQYRLLRGETAEIHFSLPADEKLLDVQGAGVRDWKQTVGEDRNTYVVRLYSAAKETLQLQIDSERPLPEGPFAVGVLQAPDVQRHTGTLAIATTSELSVSVVERDDLIRVSPSEVSDTLRRAEGFYFKFYSPNPSLTLQAAPVSPRVNVQATNLYRLEGNRLRGQTSLRYDVQRAGIFTVALRLPLGVTVDGVSASSFDRYELRQQQDSQQLEIRLGKQVLGPLTVDLQWNLPVAEDVTELSLPLPEPLEVETERGLSALLVHESFEVTLDESKSQGIRTASPDDLSRENFAVPATSTMRLASAFQYQARPVSAVYSLRRRETRLVAETFTHAEVKENALLTTTTIVYDVQYAATSSFRLLVPEAVADKVEITGPAIKQRNRGEAADGLVPWTVVLHTDTLGKHAITVTYTQPISLNNAGAATAQTPLLIVQPAGVERESGQIAVTKDRNLALEDEVENAEPIDPRLLTIPSEVGFSAQSEVQLAYRYYRHPLDIKLTVTRHEVQRVVETVVTRALVETVVPEQGAVTYRARYRIKSSQRQRLHIAMPKGARFLGVSVAGRSVLPEKAPDDPALAGRDAYLLNVSRASSSDEPFTLVMLYEQDEIAPHLKTLTFLPQQMPKLLLEMPLFVGDVTYQRLFWQVWLPKRYTPTQRPPGFTDENHSLRSLLLGVGYSPDYVPELATWESDWQDDSSRSVFEFATVGRKYTYSSLSAEPALSLSYGHVPSMVLVASAVAFALMIVLLPLKLGGKLSLLMFLGFAAVLGSLYEPESVHRWAAACELGFAFGAGVWLIQGFARVRNSVRSATVHGPANAAAAGEAEQVTQSEFDLSDEAVERSMPPDQRPLGESPPTAGEGDQPKQGGDEHEN